jgi:nucleoside-diphosphate-sugar epimerase
MEILITGENDLLGYHLVPALQERDDTVRVLALPGEDTTRLAQRHVAIYRGDVRLHLAGLMGVWRPLQGYHAVNVTGTQNVCRAALAAGVRRLVHVSSWTVYGMALGQPAREDFPLRPFPEPYALTKAAGDRVVQRLSAQEHLPAVILRPGTFFGPGDRLHFGRMAERVRAGKGLIVGSGRNALPFVYVSDVVQGLPLAAEHAQAVGQAYNISTDQPLTQEEFLCAIAQELGIAPPRLHAPYPALYAAFAAEQAVRLTHSRRQPVVTRLGVTLFGTDNRHALDKARRELGYTPRVSLCERVRRAATWYRATRLSGAVRSRLRRWVVRTSGSVRIGLRPIAAT